MGIEIPVDEEKKEMNDETKEQLIERITKNFMYPYRNTFITHSTAEYIVEQISAHAIRVFAKKIKEAVKAQFCEHTLETMHIEHNLLEAIDDLVGNLKSAGMVFDPEEPDAVEAWNRSANEVRVNANHGTQEEEYLKGTIILGDAAIAQLQARNLELAVECEKKDARIAELEKAQR